MATAAPMAVPASNDGGPRWTYGETSRHHWVSVAEGPEGDARDSHAIEGSCETLRIAGERGTLARLVGSPGPGAIVVRSGGAAIRAEIVGIDHDPWSASGWTLVAGIDPTAFYGFLRDAPGARLEVVARTAGGGEAPLASRELPARRMGEAARLMLNACGRTEGPP